MKDRTVRRTARFAVMLVATAIVAGCIPAVRPDVSGGWTATQTFTSGPMAGFTQAFSLQLEDDDGTLSGNLRLPSPGMQSFSLALTYGRVRGDSVVIEAAGMNDLLTTPAAVSIRLDGEVSGVTMTGIGTQTVDGRSFDFTWEAVLTTPPAPIE